MGSRPSSTGALRTALGLILWLACFPSSAFAETVLGVSQMHEMKTRDGLFTIAVIETTDRPNRFFTHERELADALYGQAEDWVIAERKRRFPDVPTEFFDQMREKNRASTNPRRMMIFFAGDKLRPKDIRAVMEVQGIDESNPKLGIERDLEIELPRKPFTYDHVPVLHSSEDFHRNGSLETSGGDPEIRETVTEELSGLPAEIGKLTISGQAKDGLFALIFSSMVYGENPVLGGSWPFKPRNLMEYVGRIPLAAREFSPFGSEFHVRESEYFIRCHPKMIRYYERLGFRLDESIARKPRPEGKPEAAYDTSDDIVMRIDRVGLLKIASEKLVEKPGYLAFWKGKRVRIHPEVVWAYGEILGQKLRKLHRNWKTRLRIELRKVQIKMSYIFPQTGRLPLHPLDPRPPVNVKPRRMSRPVPRAPL